MASQSQVRRLHYRRAKVGTSKVALQTLLSKALKTLDHPKDRLQPITATGSELQLLNYSSQQGGMLCGNMFSFAKGAAQLLMREQEVKAAGDEAASYPLEAMHPPTADGASREFLDSILYFCVFKNHVLVLQARGLRANAFEDHVGWLLAQSGVVTNEALILADQASITAKEAIKSSHVKVVSIGMPLGVPISEGIQAKKARFRISGPILHALRQLIGSEVDSMKLENALDGNIEATLQLKWSRTTTAGAQQVLDNIAVALRNMEPDDVNIRLNDGTTLSGDNLKLAVPVSVTIRDGVLEQTTLFKTMREQMKHLIECNMIEAG